MPPRGRTTMGLGDAPLELIYKIVTHLPWHARYRFALCSKRMLQLVPAVTWEAPDSLFEEVGTHLVEGLAGWVELRHRSTGGIPLCLHRLNLDFRVAVASQWLYGELEEDGPSQGVSLRLWQAVLRLLRCVEVVHLFIEGLAVPDGLSRSAFSGVSRAICAEVNRFSRLEHLCLRLPCPCPEAGTPFHARLDASFPFLRALLIDNEGSKC